MTTETNVAFMRLARRAESVEPQTLVDTFVDAGPLFALLSTADHQIVYGRRGTGKTHALLYLSQQVEDAGDLVAYVDMRTIGSTAGLYSDTSLPVAERGTRLLLDTLESIYDSLVDDVLEASEAETMDFAAAMGALDRLANEITSVRVAGTVEERTSVEREEAERESGSAGVRVSLADPALTLGTESSGEVRDRVEITRTHRGEITHTVRVGAIARTLGDLLEALPGKRLWITLDEWSVVPQELQPLLGDLVRRCFLPVRNVTVKIGAIEYRSVFILKGEAPGEYVGIEIGADMSADVDLDDFMVFGNDADRAKAFFKQLVHKHVRSYFAGEGQEQQVAEDADRFIQQAFTQENVFEEFVRAAEGVPRDAMNILSLAAQQADDRQLSMNDIRSGARKWYLRNKEAAVSADAQGRTLLDWIIDRVIGERQARAFLLEQDQRHDDLVVSLYDARVLHVIKKGVAARDQPGRRFDVYSIDYGCYVELLTTARAPKGLYEIEEEGDQAVYVSVPVDDYRSIRRAILDLTAFEGANDS